MVEPDPVDAEQRRGDAGEAGGEREGGRRRVALPEVGDLEEGPTVGVALLERPILGAPPVHGVGDDVAGGGHLGGARHLAQPHVPGATEGLDGLGVEGVGAGQSGELGGGHGVRRLPRHGRHDVCRAAPPAQQHSGASTRNTLVGGERSGSVGALAWSSFETYSRREAAQTPHLICDNREKVNPFCKNRLTRTRRKERV